jgi:hypothetical protein
VRDYEFSFTRKNGRLTLVCVTLCNNDLDARAAAQSMMRPEFARVEIWSGSERVARTHAH